MIDQSQGTAHEGSPIGVCLLDLILHSMERGGPNKSYDPRQWFSVSKLYEPSPVTTTATTTINSTVKSVTQPITNQRAPTLVSDQYGTYEVQGNSNESNTFAPNPLEVDDSTYPNPDREKYDPRKLEYFITALNNMIAILPHEYKKKFPYDMVCQLAHAVLDGTVFEITKGLQDIQKITEQNLATKRTTVVNEHKANKCELLKRQQVELSSVANKLHKKIIIEKQHNEEKELFNQRCEKELTSLDQRLVLELDRQTSDQQATLQRAGLPFFFITNEPEDIKLQMYVLSFIIRLAA